MNRNDDKFLSKLRKILAQRQKDASRLAGEIESLKRSLSWRVGAPLRWLTPRSNTAIGPRPSERRDDSLANRVGESFVDQSGRTDGSETLEEPASTDPQTLEFQTTISEVENTIQRLRSELTLLKSSISWRLTHPIRQVDQFLIWNGAWMARFGDSVVDNRLRLKLAAAQWARWIRARGKPDAKRIIYISGEPETAGNHYRVAMYANSLINRGYDVETIPIGNVAKLIPLIEVADAVVIWRASWSDVIQRVVKAVRRKKKKLIFDVDDLVVDPTIAKFEFVDGLRTNGFEEKDAAIYYGDMQKTLLAADFCSASTDVLAAAMRRLGKTVFVLPNGFDEQTFGDIRAAAGKRQASRPDGLIRIGYAGGSRTHQKDFARAVPAVARILHEHPNCRLVLFRKDLVDEFQRCVDLAEYPEFKGVEGQVEWRLMVPLRQLPDELVRFDINLAPVETGNVFCEAKSELKYFEAALAKIPTIASPTDPFARAIKNGETGFLAGNLEEWYAALKQLVTEPELRRQIGHAAFFDVIWKYGPERRAELAASVMEQILQVQTS